MCLFCSKNFLTLLRLRLINSFFGSLLDYFLFKIGDMMNISNHKFDDRDIKYFVNTRGKLTNNKVSIFSAYVLYDKILIYLVNFLSLKKN